MSTDDEHRRRLVRDLESSREVDADAVGVVVSDGVVTVSGEIGSFAERLAVRSIMLGDRATREIVDELRVAPLPGDWRLSDPEVAALVAGRLNAHPELADVFPTCGFHILQLDGVVTDPAHRRTAHHLARTTRGVHFVVDRIETLTPARTVSAH